MSPTDSCRPRVFEVRLGGEVWEAEVGAALGNVELVRSELMTVLRGRFGDQTALHSVLRLLRAYGLEVTEIRRITRTGAPAGLEQKT